MTPLIIVCDTNIYISSLISAAGPPDEVLAMGRDRKIIIAISAEIISEIRKVLVHKLLMEERAVSGITDEIRRFTWLVKPDIRLNVIKSVPADNRILECAVKSKAQFIVSGDKKHLLRLKSFRRTIILSPAGFLATLQNTS